MLDTHVWVLQVSWRGDGPSPAALGGAACVYTLQGQRGSFGPAPLARPRSQRRRVAGSEAVSRAQHMHQGTGVNFLPLCGRAPPWRLRNPLTINTPRLRVARKSLTRHALPPSMAPVSTGIAFAQRGQYAAWPIVP